MLRDYFDRDPKRFPVLTVEVECVLSDPRRSSYAIAGKRQRRGDKARLSLGMARLLEQQGKARILPGSEMEEVL